MIEGIKVPVRYENHEQLKQAIKHEWESNSNLRSRVWNDINFDTIEEFLDRAHRGPKGRKELSSPKFGDENWQQSSNYVSNIGEALEELGYLTKTTFPGILHEKGSGERIFYCLADLESLENYEYAVPDRSIGDFEHPEY